jgi:hypothetical protein
MATRPARKKSRTPSEPASKYRVPLRIVPLHPHVRVAAAAAPNLTYRNGPLLTNVAVFPILWGKAWQSAAIVTVSDQINTFFDFILTSGLMDQLAEYSVPGKSIGHGSRTGSLNLTDSEPGDSVDDATIQQTLQSAIAAGTLPAPTANTLYFLYLPPGTQVTMSGGASCNDFCGYHEVSAGNIFYAVMPFPGCAGCQGGLATLAALTSTSSHELCEAITDPIPGQGWYDDTHGEIGDICAWQTKRIGDYTVQLEWSNSAGSCI